MNHLFTLAALDIANERDSRPSAEHAAAARCRGRPPELDPAPSDRCRPRRPLDVRQLDAERTAHAASSPREPQPLISSPA